MGKYAKVSGPLEDICKPGNDLGKTPAAMSFTLSEFKNVKISPFRTWLTGLREHEKKKLEGMTCLIFNWPSLIPYLTCYSSF